MCATLNFHPRRLHWAIDVLAILPEQLRFFCPVDPSGQQSAWQWPSIRDKKRVYSVA